MNKFLFVWIGELISNIGSGMTTFALTLYVYNNTKSVMEVSIITLLSFLPTVLLSPLGGLLADRYDRRLLMIIGDLFSAFGLIYILLNFNDGKVNLLHIKLGIVISSIFISLLEPSYKALVTDLISEENYAKASAMVQMANSSKFLFSPLLAGIILSFTSIQTILWIDILTIFITISIISFIKYDIKINKTENEGNLVNDLKYVVKYILYNNSLLYLIIIMIFVCFFMGVIQIVIKPIILSVADETTLGISESISAIGLLLGSIYISIFGIKKSYVNTIVISGIFCGLFMIGIGINRSLILIILSMLLFFTTLPFLNSSADAIVRGIVDNNLQGRVWGIIGFVTQLGTVIAYFITGLIADKVFEPLFSYNNNFTNLFSDFIGIGIGRGSAFILVISGIGLLIVSIFIKRVLVLEK